MSSKRAKVSHYHHHCRPCPCQRPSDIISSTVVGRERLVHMTGTSRCMRMEGMINAIMWHSANTLLSLTCLEPWGWFGCPGEREENEATRLRARTQGLGSGSAMNQPSVSSLLLLNLCSFFIKWDEKAPFYFNIMHWDGPFFLLPAFKTT